MSTTTTRPTGDTTTAQFLAPETHQRAVSRPLRISIYRGAVDTLNWNRNDLSGATHDEFVRMDVRTRMEKYIAIVDALTPRVAARFTLDLVHAERSIERARQTVQRWAGFQAQTEG